MLKSEAYKKFKKFLFNGELRPGQMFSQRELCEIIGISIAPLRDALHEIQNEGLIELIPNRGVKIILVNDKFVIESFQIRKFLEVGAIREIIKKKIPDIFIEIKQEMNDIKKSSKVCIDSQLLKRALEIDEFFHKSLVRNLNNSLLLNLHEKVYDRVKLIKKNIRYTSERLVLAMNEHIKIIEDMNGEQKYNSILSLELHLSIAENNFLIGDQEI